MARLPDFVVIGSPKAGTTSLCDSLGAHPDIYMFPPKETHFFNRHYDRGIDWYASLFEKAPADALVGEGTPDYTQGLLTKTTAERMAKHMPSAKLIYVVREPIARLKSHYVQELDNGLQNMPPEVALDERPFLIETSRYMARLNDFRAQFADEQIKVIFFEELIADPTRWIEECCAFLGVTRPTQEVATLNQLNAKDTKGTDGALLRSLRKSRLYKSANWIMPRGVVAALKPILRKKLDHAQVPSWSDDALNRAREILKPDTAAFLRFVGRSDGAWPNGGG